MSAQSSLWQLLPDLTDEQFESLKADIAERGVMVPVEYDETGALLDGHHRVRACEELGITEWPRIVRGGMDDDQKAEHVLALNLERRHLTREQRRELVRGLRERGWSLRRIGERLGVHHDTVSQDLAGVGNPTPALTVTGSDGKTYPARAPERTPSVFATTDREQREAQRIVQRVEVPGSVATITEARRAASDQRRQEARERAAELGRATTEERGPRFVEVFTGDARDVMQGLADESVDMIFTDPPYDRESLPLYSTLAEDAERLLKPGGSLIAYAGTYALPELLASMAPHLTFWWLLGLDYGGATSRFPGKNVFVNWKPLVWLTNGQRANATMVTDLFRPEGSADKTLHDWAQGVDAATYYIKNLTEPGDLVLDPFCGSGTTLVAAKQIGRRAIGIEIDAVRADVARGRSAAVRIYSEDE